MKPLVSRHWNTTLHHTLFFQVRMSHAPGPVFTMDYYTIDGVTGKVGSFVDWSDPTHLVQATGAAQVPLPQPHADFFGRLCATFSTQSQQYVSNRPAVQSAYLHDGSGSEWACSHTWTATSGTSLLCATYNGGSSCGMHLYCNAGQITYAVYNASVQAVQNLIGTASNVTANVPTILQVRLATASTPQGFVKLSSSGSALQGANTNTPSATAPAGNFTLGGRSPGGLGFLGRMRAWVGAKRILTAGERYTRDQWFRLETGKAA